MISHNRYVRTDFFNSLYIWVHGLYRFWWQNPSKGEGHINCTATMPSVHRLREVACPLAAFNSSHNGTTSSFKVQSWHSAPCTALATYIHLHRDTLLPSAKYYTKSHCLRLCFSNSMWSSLQGGHSFNWTLTVYRVLFHEWAIFHETTVYI